ncbi:MAG: MlaD family protein [Pseudonocardia sp.]
MTDVLTARSARTLLAIAALFAVGLSYLLIGVARIDPFSSPMQMTVHLTRSGGLLETSQVSYRGHQVGRVRSIRLGPDGVRVTIGVTEGTRIPVDTEVVVASLSAAGEQYLDFRPRTDGGPFLADGAVVQEPATRTPVPFSQVISQITRLAEQVDPVQVAAVVAEMERAFGGAAPDIQRVIDGGDLLLAGLEESLPNTVGALRNGRVVLDAAYDLRGDLADFSGNARSLSGTLRDADPTVRELLTDSPESLALIQDVVRENGPSVAALLGDLGTTTDVVALRLPALGEFLPGLSLLGPAGTAALRGTKIATLVDTYPRPTCDYGTPRRAPTIGGSPAPRINLFCEQTGPRSQQRGSANVPRPRGDDGAGPRPGADPEQRARAPKDNGG